MAFYRPIAYLFALGVLTGCASTEVTELETSAADQELARPETIHVYPFAASRADIPSWTAAAIRYEVPAEPETAEELEAGRQLGALVASELAKDINEMGLAASVASSETRPKVGDLMLTGYFEAVEQGSARKRVLLGFGSGNAELTTAVEGYQMTTLGPRLLGEGTVDSGGGKTPGVAAPLVLLAATGNPIGLALSGTTRIVGEATGRSKLEGAAKRTASEIADVLRERFRARGWIP